MATTFYFLEAPDGTAVVDWFRALTPPPERIAHAGSDVLYFRALGPLVTISGDVIDERLSPLVSIIQPRVTNHSLATVGEVHFLAAGNLLRPVLSKFRRWLEAPTTAMGISPADDDAGYFLEGEIKNISSKVYALPSGQAELEAGRYFISDADAARDQTTLRKRLRLRGVDLG
jgi:hypothetical protein